MDQSRSCEANRFSASQEIPRILWNPKVHYRIYNYPPPVHIPSLYLKSILDIKFLPNLRWSGNKKEKKTPKVNRTN
jgi:hypothetical protein